MEIKKFEEKYLDSLNDLLEKSFHLKKEGKSYTPFVKGESSDKREKNDDTKQHNFVKMTSNYVKNVC